MSDNWSRYDLEDIGRNLAWGGIRHYNENRRNIKGMTMGVFVEKYVLDDKFTKDLIRQSNNRAAIVTGIGQALAEYKERRQNEPNLVLKPTGSSFEQNQRRETERKNKKER